MKLEIIPSMHEFMKTLGARGLGKVSLKVPIIATSDIKDSRGLVRRHKENLLRMVRSNKPEKANKWLVLGHKEGDFIRCHGHYQADVEYEIMYAYVP